MISCYLFALHFLAATPTNATTVTNKTAVPNISARRDNLSETLHGKVVDDPYRWLEDGDAGALRRTFNVDGKCANCKGDLCLIALIKTAATDKKILAAMGLPTLPPAATPARAPPCMNFDDWEN